MEIRYFGWSSVTVLHEDVRLAFDLDGDIPWMDPGARTPTIFCVTHGHNEHCRSLLDLLDSAATNSFPIHLASSAPVVEYADQAGIPVDQKHILEAGDSLNIFGTRVTAFAWKHMNLLPPGLIPKIVHLGRLAVHPLDFLRIGLGASRLPRNAPTLGFYVRFPDGRTLLNYSEGLHRLTDESEVERVAREFPSDILLFGVEPEDIKSIPKWVSLLRPRQVLIYEPHRLWRERFKMSCLDLGAYARALEAYLDHASVRALVPGHAFAIPENA